MPTLNMLPGLSQNYLTYRRLVKAIHACQFVLVYTFRVIASYLTNFLLRHFSARRTFAASGLPHLQPSVRLCTSATGVTGRRSFLLYPIGNVIQDRAQKQMIGIYARWVIAFVQHMQRVGNWAMAQLPRKAMGSFRHSLSACSAVARVVTFPRPFPAAVGLLHVLPKPPVDSLTAIFCPARLRAKAALWLGGLKRMSTSQAIALKSRRASSGGDPATSTTAINAITLFDVSGKGIKGCSAVQTGACYGSDSQGVNLQSRFSFGQARSLRTTAIGLLCIIALATPVIAVPQGPRPLISLQQSPCPDTDNSERCQLRRAVSAALDEIANLKKQLQAAAVAIEEQEKAIRAANAAIEAGAKERAAYDRTLAVAEKVIAQQMGLIATYERAIATLQTMVDMALKRIDTLEHKVDSANRRTATLGVLLTIAGIVAGVLAR